MNGKISVLMGIYNCEKTLEKAIKSILDQTYTNWELIMCDDGSKDNTYSIAKSLADKDERIILIKNEHNMGLNYTLNNCLKYATGKYIARMDADDISLPHRFETQINYLESQNEYKIVSCPMILFDQEGRWGNTSCIEYPKAKDIAKGNVINHAPVMMFKECMDKVGGYTVDKRMLRVEDLNLWCKLYNAGYQVRNLVEPLYCMRNDKNALSRRKYKYYINACYARIVGTKLLNLSPIYYIYALRPLIIGLIPSWLRQSIRKKQWKENEKN